jgi:transposase
MAYIRGDRQQSWLMPPSVEDYIPATDPVRAYDAFVEALDLKELGFELDDNRVGAPEFEPRAMIKLLVYAYSYGLRGSRKIERACHHNLSFIWLTGNLRPDHKTICRFRRDHHHQLTRLLKQCARLCIKLNLIDGNTLFVDGTKIKANASIDKTWSRERGEALLKETDNRIEKLLADIEQIDQDEEHRESLVQMEKDLANKQALKQRVASVLDQLNRENKDTLNTTDPECIKVKDKQGYAAGYNMQAVVDDKNGLIVHADVVAEANDAKQLAPQIEAANTNIGGTCSTACADAGYANTKAQKEVADKNILVVVPSQRQAMKEAEGPFSKDQFSYDPKSDTYTCPVGKKLVPAGCDGYVQQYRMESKTACLACPNFGACTSNKIRGRIVGRLVLQQEKDRFEKQYLENRHIFQRRKEKAEHPFGHIKRNLGVQSFLLRGLDGVKAEAGLLAVAFNLTRLITILGVAALVQQLNGS